MEMSETHSLVAGRDKDNDRDSLQDVEDAGYAADDGRDSLYSKQTVVVPRKPVQKSVMSHFREMISPTGSIRVMFPGAASEAASIHVVSPESASRSLPLQTPASQFFFSDSDLDIISAQASPQSAIRERRQSTVPSQDLPIIAEESRMPLPTRPMSFASIEEQLDLQPPEAPRLFEMPRAAPTPPPVGEGYRSFQASSSRDHLLARNTPPLRQSPLPSPPPPRRDSGSWSAKGGRDWWGNEFLSCLVSLLATIAIIIILRVYENKPLSEGPQSITLNSVLAIFITIAEAGLMLLLSEAMSQLKWIWFKEDARPVQDFEKFDQASRGLIGAMKLLKYLKFGHHASLGAMIIVLSIAISPFTQQIVSYQDRLAPLTTGSSSEAVRSDVFSAYNPTQMKSGVPDLNIQQAVKMGLFNAVNDTIPAVSPSCQTGNCTWPDFSSLAICATIANVTSFLTINPLPGNLISPAGYKMNSNATLPNGAYLEAGDVSLNITTPSNVFNGVTLSPMNHSLAFTNEPNAAYTTINNYFVIWQNGNRSGQGEFGAIEVLTHWCANTYTVSVDAGIPSTNISSSSVNIGSASSNVTLTVGDPSNPTGQQPGQVILNPTNSSTQYTVDGPANMALTTYMSNTFRGMYVPGINGGYTTDAAQALVGALIEHPELEDATGLAADALQLAGVMNLTQNIAMSMTNTIRSQPFTGPPATGTSWTHTTHIMVHWGWLTYLLILLILSFAFLIGVIIKTRNAKIDVLRSSALATMTSLSREMTEYMGPIQLRDEHSQKAREMRIRLEKGAHGWSLEGRIPVEMAAPRACPWW